MAKATRLRKPQIAHLLRAVAGVTGHASFVMVGTGAVIARSKVLTLDLMRTREIDVYAADTPDADRLSDLIDGSIGEGSPFDETFGYYAHGVSAATACLPDDWAVRATRLAIPGGAACLCPEENDIALAKLCAWRQKDRDWLAAGLATGLLDIAAMQARSTTISNPNAPAPDEIGRRLLVLRQGAPP